MTKLKKILPVTALALAAILVFLYGLEYYDFTFIDRPVKETEASTPAESEPVPETDAPDVTEPPSTTAPVVTEPPVTEEPVPVVDPEKFLDVSAAGVEGYYLTNQPYNADMILAELRVAVETTDEFSLRQRYWNKPTYEYEHSRSDAKLVWSQSAEDIPALEAYMGYIFADTGKSIYIYDSYGRHLNYFNPAYFEFAYKRDKLGNPLMRSVYNYTVSTEDGSQSKEFKDFKYFYLGADGGIYNSGYNNAAENRGIMADYPAYYGTTQGSLGRLCTYNRVVQKTVKGKLESFIRTRWNITWDGKPINDTIYYALFPYSSGYACVTDEEDVMYFVNDKGKRTFETKNEYVLSGRYVVDRLLLPLDETTALGCYYYEHGLVKARRQIYDRYQLEEYDLMYVMSDEYVMLYENGTEFPVPTGYSVKTYSNGVILLEKNGTYGYMDYTGAWVTNPVYEDAKDFMEGLAACKKDGKWGMIDTKGNIVLPFVYDYIQSASSGVIITHSENGWNTYLKMTK